MLMCDSLTFSDVRRHSPTSIFRLPPCTSPTPHVSSSPPPPCSCPLGAALCKVSLLRPPPTRPLPPPLFTIAQTKAIADGLERSGQRFMWVVKNLPDDNSKLEKVLPDGFLKRTKGVGLVVKGWAPQVAVLSHDSVGGFVTHCGWNSVLEAVVAGKLMVAWPLDAEQHLNRAALLVKTMGMAIPVEQRERDRFVTGEELATRLTELMDSEKGRAMNEKGKVMRAKALDARKVGRSSMAALEKVVNTWMEE